MQAVGSGREDTLGGAYYNVLRNTVEELAKRKGVPTCTRFSIEELAMIEVIRRLTGASTRSEALRLAVRLSYGVLSGARETQAGKVIIQNPIVNMNINHAEARPQVNVKVDLGPVIEELKRLGQPGPHA